MSVNADLRDAVIEHEILNRRVTADVQNQIDRRLARLQRDLAQLLGKVDPLSVHPTYQPVRLKKLEKAAGVLVREAYEEIALLVSQTAVRVAQAEAKQVAQAVRDALP